MKRIVFLLCMSVVPTIIDGRLSLPNTFQAMVHKQPIFQPLLSEYRSGEPVDVHMLSRFLKEAAEYPCIVLTRPGSDQELIAALFPKASVYQMSLEISHDAVIKQIQAVVNSNDGYALVFTHLGSDTALAQELHKNLPHIGVVAIDALFNNSPLIDMPKLLRLMKRKIHVVCTAALIPIKYEERKFQYMRGINRIIDLGYHPYVAESCVFGTSFLDDCSKRVLYTSSNNAALKNKGVNESVSLLSGLWYWNFDDDDIILKLTGRYFLQSDAIIRLLEDDEDIVALAKFEKRDISSVLTGCFAMRCDLMKEMYASYDYDVMERDMICIEHAVGPYLDKLEEKGSKIIRVDCLDVEANMFFTQGTDEISYW